MDPKSTVLKSKSSNSCISKKSREDRKRQSKKHSRSSADFPHQGVKKRGVYVENRCTKINLVNDKKELPPRRPLPRPRPGQKKFLASVFTILSKSTTGTQYPEIKNETNGSGQKQCKYTENERKKDTQQNNKEKFKSRVLNKKFVREDKKKMVVLQSRKEIVQTPSNYSEWSYKDASQRSNTSNCVVYDDSNMKERNCVANDLKNCILEGRNIKKVKKLRYLEEPETLVSEAPKVQKNLYNFFVDLLETTISVYNVAAEYDKAPSDISKTELQVNESVANILNIDKTSTQGPTTNINKSLSYNLPNHEEYFVNMEAKAIKFKTSTEQVRLKSKRKLKADSFIYQNKTILKTSPKKSKSANIDHLTFKKKSDLINVFKQELEDTQMLREPKNIFQALRVMARNKKRIRFDPKTFTDECVLKGHKVISRKTIRNKTNNNLTHNRPVSAIGNVNKLNKGKKYIRKLHSEGELEEESNHSLEVYDVDYESKPVPYLKKNITLTYCSNSSQSDIDFDNDALLNRSKENLDLQFKAKWK